MLPDEVERGHLCTGIDTHQQRPCLVITCLQTEPLKPRLLSRGFLFSVCKKSGIHWRPIYLPPPLQV